VVKNKQSSIGDIIVGIVGGFFDVLAELVEFVFDNRDDGDA